MYFPHLNVSAMFTTVGVGGVVLQFIVIESSTVLQFIFIESSIAKKINEEAKKKKKRERKMQLIFNYRCCTYQEGSVVSRF